MAAQGLDTGLLDSIIVGRVEPHIYAFTTETVPNYLKVGDTYRPVSTRIAEWRVYFPNLCCVYNRSAKIDDNIIFRDFAVHSFLENEKHRRRLRPDDLPSIPYYSREFFKDATPHDIDEAIADISSSAEVGDGRYAFYSSDHLPKETSYARGKTLEPRPNQQEVIDNFDSAIKNGRKNLLMYAVMRFGKSFTSMCCAKKMGARLVLVVSAKADVSDEWKKTVQSHGNFEGYVFANKETLRREPEFIHKSLEDGEKVVLFLTLQDLQGPDIKESHKEVFTMQWDLLIVDETHFGARAEHYGKLLATKRPFKKSEIEKEEKRQMEGVDTLDALSDAVKQLRVNITLHLSGTPYRILMSSEFEKEDVIAFVQFSDIADAQQRWIEENRFIEEIDEEHGGKINEWDNPYYGFPQLIRFAFNPNQASLARIEQLRAAGATTSFAELFRPKSLSPANPDHKKFEHEDVALSFLKVIDGSEKDPNVLGFLGNRRIKDGKLCRHMVMVLPYCASCDAMEQLLESHKADFRNLSDYEIVNISGLDRRKDFDDTASVKKHIADCEKAGKKTITFTVNRMLTGNTVPQWDTMIYLKQTSSPEEYDQAVYRLQNPFIKEYRGDDDKTIKINMKPQTILVDFDPERIFRLQERKSQIYNVNSDNNGNSRLRERIEKELSISPIIVLDHKKLREVTATNIIDAVRDYAATKSIVDEASDMSIDVSLLSNDNIRGIVDSLNPIDSKKGLIVNAVDPDKNDKGDDVDTNKEGNGNPGEDQPQPSSPDANPKPDSDEAQLKKKLSTYYAFILFFAFLTDDKVTSLEDIIQVLESTDDNKRIAKHLHLSKEDLQFIQDHINGFVLRDLDYKIENTNSINRDSSKSPFEKVDLALTKFGRMSESEVVTPKNIAEEMVSILPDNVLNLGPVLDIASKRGEFTFALIKRFGFTISDKVYSVCTSKLAYEFTRKVYKLLSLPVGHIFDTFTSYDLINRNKKKEYLIPQILKEMKFSTIIGNPPYQEVVAQKDTANGQKRSSSIFQHFQLVADKIGRYTTLIYPGARWIHRSGKGLDQFGLNQINDPHLELLKFFPDADEVFSEVGIADGLSIVVKDRNKKKEGFTYVYSQNGEEVEISAQNPGESLFSLNPLSNSIVSKLDAFIKRYACLHDSVLSQKLFSIESDFVEKNPNLVREYNIGDSFDRETEIKLFTNDKAGKAGRARWYVTNRDVITTGKEYLDRWKVIVSSANAGGQKRSNQIEVIDNYSAFGRARVALKTFGTEREAQNFLKYATSELIRFAFLLTDEALTSLAKKVPDILDYSDNNRLIDFNGDVDVQLYKILKINKKDQQFIKKTLAEKAS